VHAECALCHRIERHAAAIVLNTTAAGCLHSALDSALWGHSGNVVGSSSAPWARCGHASCGRWRHYVDSVSGGSLFMYILIIIQIFKIYIIISLL